MRPTSRFTVRLNDEGYRRDLNGTLYSVQPHSMNLNPYVPYQMICRNNFIHQKSQTGNFFLEFGKFERLV